LVMCLEAGVWRKAMGSFTATLFKMQQPHHVKAKLIFH